MARKSPQARHREADSKRYERQVRKLIRNGFRQGEFDPKAFSYIWKSGALEKDFTFSQALRVAKARQRKIWRDEEAEAEYLQESGWTQSGLNGEVWSKPNWAKKDGGICCRTLCQAYHIQYGLDVKAKVEA